jgi:hypothetical protein
MADELSMELQELLPKAELDRYADFLREGVRVLAQAGAGSGGQSSETLHVACTRKRIKPHVELDGRFPWQRTRAPR